MYLNAKIVIHAAILCLAALLPAALGAQDAQVKQRVAIFEPEEDVPKGEKPQLKPMTKAIIWGALEEGLVSTGRYTFLDRSRVSQAMKELNAQRDFNIYNQEGRKDFQQRLAADLICLTSVVTDKKGINIRVSIMNVETGEIEHSASHYRAVRAIKNDQAIALMAKSLAARVIPLPVGEHAEADTRTLKHVIEDVTNYWEGNGNLKGYGGIENSPSSFELKGHVYRIIIAPSIALPSYFYVAKDDNKTWKKIETLGISKPGEMFIVSAHSVFVTDTEDVYVSGVIFHSKNNIETPRGTIWKNGSVLFQGDIDTAFEDIWVWGTNVFTVARPKSSFASDTLSWVANRFTDKSSLWLNGKELKRK